MRFRPVSSQWLLTACLLAAPVLRAQTPPPPSLPFTFCGISGLGAIQAACQFGTTGTFDGFASVFAGKTWYSIVVRGVFTGNGSMRNFVLGSFDISDPEEGSLYLYASDMWLLGSGLTTGNEALYWSAETDAVSRPVSARITTAPGIPLPTRELKYEAGFGGGKFNGPGDLRGDVSFSAETGQQFSGALTYRVQVGIQLVPEPTTLALFAAGLLTVVVGARARKQERG